MKLQPNAAIHIKDLKIRAIIGTREDERTGLQDLLLNISFTYDAALAAQSDALGHAVDYTAIHAKIVERVAATKFFLLERLAAFILDIIMEDGKIISVEVILEKFGVLPGATSVLVKMSAERSDIKTRLTTRCC
jgi:D-erythro-7,8-dihydroneopterin triphosphate epimerase